MKQQQQQEKRKKSLTNFENNSFISYININNFEKQQFISIGIRSEN